MKTKEYLVVFPVHALIARARRCAFCTGGQV